MCGIVGYTGKNKCLDKIIDGLEVLEYRGYDSVGVAYKESGKTVIKKTVGRIDDLRKIVDTNVESYVGIGHTRWATHGEANTINSHPHKVGDITLVHNGIIENYKELKEQLNCNYVSETDSEVVAALINKLLKEKKNMIEVLVSLKDYLEGSYALVIMNDNDDKIYAIRNGSPLIIGKGKDGSFAASDVPAIVKYTKDYYLLLDNEFCILDKNNISFYNEKGKSIDKEMLTFTGNVLDVMKSGYEHFMLKEINDEPKALKDTVKDFINDIDLFDKYKLNSYDNITIIGCGSAYHVALVGKSLITNYSDKNVICDIASEYRYNHHHYGKKDLVILISQSGETADTLAVLRDVKSKGVKTLSIVNVVGSSIARESDEVIYIKAGPEIAVATTKAYTCQLAILSLMACYFGIKAKRLDKSILKEFKNIDKYVSKVIEEEKNIKAVAKLIYKNTDIFFIGRKVDYSLCMEASLKLKEVSYIHSEAYAAGELKHGTISLVEDKTPVISIITDPDIRAKTISNIKEVKARKAFSIVITNEEIRDKDLYDKEILIDSVNEFIDPILVIVKCQLLAYYVAKLNKCDIDKPRNLAKSVTVE